MKYYLGKLKNAKYEPIQCIEEDDILSVINYTSKFYDEEELRTELINRKLIDGNEPLAYIYRQKDNYLKLNNGENLTFSYAKEYNTSNGLYKTLVREKYNQDLYTFLSKMIVRKYSGVKNHIAEREKLILQSRRNTDTQYFLEKLRIKVFSVQFQVNEIIIAFEFSHSQKSSYGL